MKLTRQIEETVPMVKRMLVTGHRYNHFRNAIPNISEAAAIIQAYMPCIGSGSKGKHREGVMKFMHTNIKKKVIRLPCPHQLPFVIKEGNTVVTKTDRFVDLDEEADGNGTQVGQDIGLIAPRFHDFPL